MKRMTESLVFRSSTQRRMHAHSDPLTGRTPIHELAVSEERVENLPNRHSHCGLRDVAEEETIAASAVIRADNLF